jgi:hypothetical protein
MHHEPPNVKDPLTRSRVSRRASSSLSALADDHPQERARATLPDDRRQADRPATKELRPVGTSEQPAAGRPRPP